MKPFQEEGIILHTFDYRDYDQILTLFTPNEGIVEAVKAGANRPKRRGGVETSPLTQAEFILVRGKQELMKCREISVKDRHLGCRQNIETLETACELLQALRNTQMPGKASPALYALLESYLQKIPKIDSPQRLALSFRMKLLRHEGHFSNQLTCTLCQEVLPTLHFSHGEYFCRKHAPSGCVHFSKEETEELHRCAFGKTFSEVLSQSMHPEFQEKTRALFNHFFLLRD